MDDSSSPVLPENPTPDDLVEFVSRSEIMSLVKPEHLPALKNDLECVTLAADQELFGEGTPVDSMYFIVDGIVDVTKQREDGQEYSIAELGRGETVGEMQILSGGVRSATIRGKTDCRLVRFSKEAFDRFLASHEQVMRRIGKIVVPRLHRDQMIRVLPRLFGELDQNAIRDIEAMRKWRHLERGEMLYEQGQPSDSFAIVISGRLQVTIHEENGESRVVNELGQGESVGEMGVLSRQPRSASVKAIRDSELVEFSRDQFDSLVKKYPHVLSSMLEQMVERLRRSQTGSLRFSHGSGIAIAPASPNVPLDQFSSQLYQAISKFGDCLLLRSDIVDSKTAIKGMAQAEDGEPNDLRLRMWLNEQENKYRFILYQADARATAWSHRCLRQADEILLLGNAAEKPHLTDVEQAIEVQDAQKGNVTRQSLVLLHADDRPPSGTIEWLRPRPDVHRHFHVRQGVSETGDLLRVARFVAGHAVGLVLSGGGARGFAHVGVIRALQKHNIPIDMIAGVSMGALLAAGFAYSEAFESMVSDIKAQLKGSMSDYTLPVVSLAVGRRFNKRLKRLFGDVQIEDLRLPYFCVSSNLTRGEIKIHDRGPLWRCLRASGSLPGIVPPVIFDGDLHFDGCLLNNLPMDVMRQYLGNGKVIAVDVVPPVDEKMGVTDVESPSGLQILWSRVNPFTQRINLPNILNLLQRAGELGAVQARSQLIKKNIADKYLAPEFVKAYEVLDFSTVDQVAAKGVQYAEAEISSWTDLDDFRYGVE